MKRFLHILLLVFISLSANAQKIKFTDSTNTWNEVYYNQGGSGGTHTTAYERFFYDGDTAINGKIYQILYVHECSFSIPRNENKTFLSALIREDSSGVYAFADTGDVVMYNYNWQVGDSFSSGTFTTTVTKVDSVLINNVYHKVWELSRVHTQATFNNNINVIEGIGSTVGIFMRAYWYGLSWSQLLCFKNQNNTPAFSNMHNSFDNQSSCGEVISCPPTNINESIVTEELKPQIVPHPANTNSHILLPEKFRNSTINICNNYGQLVVKEQIQNSTKWQFQNRITIPGIYFYQISSKDRGTSYNGKFIFE